VNATVCGFLVASIAMCTPSVAPRRSTPTNTARRKFKLQSRTTRPASWQANTTSAPPASPRDGLKSVPTAPISAQRIHRSPAAAPTLPPHRALPSLRPAGLAVRSTAFATRRSPAPSLPRPRTRQPQRPQYPRYRRRVVDRRQHPPRPGALRADQHRNSEHPLQQRSPWQAMPRTTSPAATMRNTQTLSTLPFGQPAPQVDAGGHHGLVEVGRRHRCRSTIIPVPAAPNIPGSLLAPRHHPRTQSRRRRQDPVVGHQVLPRPRHQRAETFHQHFLRHHHRRRAIPPALLQRVPDLAAAEIHQPRLGYRRTAGVAAQLLEAFPIPGRHPRASVQRKAQPPRTAAPSPAVLAGRLSGPARTIPLPGAFA
jgi:hypothetical protein